VIYFLKNLHLQADNVRDENEPGRVKKWFDGEETFSGRL
jgi:hypothetical protein